MKRKKWKGECVMENQLLKEANALQQELSKWRRALHQMPEIGLHLPKTVEFVAKELEKMGINYTVYEDCSCIVALIGNGENGSPDSSVTGSPSIMLYASKRYGWAAGDRRVRRAICIGKWLYACLWT